MENLSLFEIFDNGFERVEGVLQYFEVQNCFEIHNINLYYYLIWNESNIYYDWNVYLN